jgi:hypothetical protein
MRYVTNDTYLDLVGAMIRNRFLVRRPAQFIKGSVYVNMLDGFLQV